MSSQPKFIFTSNLLINSKDKNKGRIESTLVLENNYLLEASD